MLDQPKTRALDTVAGDVPVVLTPPGHQHHWEININYGGRNKIQQSTKVSTLLYEGESAHLLRGAHRRWRRSAGGYLWIAFPTNEQESKIF